MSETEFSVGKNCGVTFAGIKPSSLVSVKKEGANDLKVLSSSFKKKGISFRVLKETQNRLVVLVYDEKRLNEVLKTSEAKVFLLSFGYSYKTAEEAVNELAARMNKKDFPHEIGVFLGYPIEDVKGFIESPHSGYKTVGTWKVYSNEECAAKTFEQYRRCSQNICQKMVSGFDLADIFGVA